MAENKRFVVTATPGASLPDVAKALGQAGLSVEQQLDSIGVIVGSAPADAHEHLQKIAGVADVAPDATVDIGPPDSPKTW